MIAWFARNHVAANLLMIGIVFLGLWSLVFKTPIEVFPETARDEITISTSLRGASPDEAEQRLAIWIENAVAGLSGINEITSRSSEGSAIVSLAIADGYDAKSLLSEVKSRVDAVKSLPNEASKPAVSITMRRHEVITVALSGNVLEQELRLFAEKVHDDLLAIPGLSQLDLLNIKNYEISLEVSKNQLKNHNLTLDEIARRLQNSSLDISAGSLKTDRGDVLIRSKGRAYQQDEFADIVIKTYADGSVLRLGDIADINDGVEDKDILSRFNGRPAVMLEIYREGNQSALDIAAKVHKYIAEQQPFLPQGIVMTAWDDDSEIVRSRLNTLISNALQGGILVLILLGLFLRPAIAVWVFIGIPVSFVGAFSLMALFGVTINTLSLFGFILVLGLVVDDAIVTGENVYKHMQHNDNRLLAAINGTKEISVPVTFGVLTTIVAFIPFAFVDSSFSRIFIQIPFVVIPVLIFSLIESKLILPAHLKRVRLLKKAELGRFSRFQQSFAEGFERAIISYYQPLLRVALQHRKTTLALFCGVFILILSVLLSGWTKFVFFPRVQSDTARMTFTLFSGTPFEVTDRYVLKAVNAAQVLQEKYRDSQGHSAIMNIYSVSGYRGDAEKGHVRFELVPSEQRTPDLTTSKLVREWRKIMGDMPGVETVNMRSSVFTGSRAPINIRVRANSSDTLEELTQTITKKLATYSGLYDISDNLADGKETLSIRLKAQAYALGLTSSQIALQVRQKIFGIQIQRILRGRDDIRVMLKLPESERESIVHLKSIMIQTDRGTVPLDEVAYLVPEKGPSTISRVNQQRMASVTADMHKEQVNTTILYRDIRLFMDNLILQYPDANYKMAGEAKDQEKSFASLTIGLCFVLFAIYSLLAIPFGSYTQPFIVMSVIPFGAIGAVVGHWLMDMNLTIMSLLGLLALTGVVVNDSLVLVDYTNKRHKELKGLMGSFQAAEQAVLMAGVARFRPVMLTSLTTFLGLVPLLFEKAVQAQFLIPMAVSLGFGIIFATFITLIMIPVNIMLAEDIKRFLGFRIN